MKHKEIIDDIISSGSVSKDCTLFSHGEILGIEKVANTRNDDYLRRYIKKILKDK